MIVIRLNVFLLFSVAEPIVMCGHTNGLRHVSFFNNNKMLVSCAEDKTLRVWDRLSGQVRTFFELRE